MKHSVHICNVDPLLLTVMSLLRHKITLMQQLSLEMTHFGSFSVFPYVTYDVEYTVNHLHYHLSQRIYEVTCSH